MKRIDELDGLRGLAALSIVLFHIHPDSFFGWTRVELFLVLSGYLTTAVALRRIGPDGWLNAFYARRIVRIWPVYFAALAAVLALNPLMNDPSRLDGLPYYLTLTQNLPRYWGADPPPFSGYFQHTWSLAAIEQFYLAWPALLAWLGPRRLIPVGLGLALASFALRCGGLHPWVLLGRCDGLALGGVLALAMHGEVDRRRSDRFFGILVASAAAMLGWSLAVPEGRMYHDAMGPRPSLTVFASAVLYTGLIGLVLNSAGHRWLAPLRLRPLRAVGTIAFGLYLLHPPILVGVGRVLRGAGFEGPLWLVDCAKVGASLLAAAALWVGVERPIQRWRCEMERRGRAATARTAGAAAGGP